MDDIDADAELRVLRARAYGPDADALSETERDRLETLEAARRAPMSVLASDPHPVADVADAPSAAPAPTPQADGTGAVARPSRSRPVLITLAVLVPLAAAGGIGLGAVIAAERAQPRPTPLIVAGSSEADHDESRARALQSQLWDDGAVRLLGAADGVVVWWGTVDGRGLTCVVVDVEGLGSLPSCEDTERVRADGIRLEGDFFHVTAAEAAQQDALELSQGAKTSVAFAGNPYTGQFMVIRGD